VKKIEAVIKPFIVERVTDALRELGIHGMTLSEASGLRSTNGSEQIYRGSSRATSLISRVKLEVVVPSERLARLVIETIEEAARTGQAGDGKIFVTEVLEAIRIRTGDWGEAAL
jgi:nitrogen regulatory protein P-II 1